MVDLSSVSGKFSDLGKESVARVGFTDFPCNGGVEGLGSAQGFTALEVWWKTMYWDQTKASLE